jgi:hypothetical protein
VPDDIIRENLSKTPTPIPRATHDAVARLERQRLSDPEWVKRWRAKGPVEWEEYAAIKTALDKPIAEDTAA